MSILLAGSADTPSLSAAPPTPYRAAIHPVASAAELASWLRRVPRTRDFPPDFADTLRSEGPAFIVEISTAPGCLPCADAWAKLGQIHIAYGWTITTLNRPQAMLRSGRLGLPWVGDPVIWLRPIGDEDRTIPIAIGTDLLPNLERNIYLATKMLTGVRAEVGVRAMAKFTGIVSPPAVSRAMRR